MSSKQDSTRQYDEIDIREIIHVLWRGKRVFIGVTLVFAVFSVILALSIPDKYTSWATLAPAEGNQTSALAGMAGQLGGLASLAGVNLPSGDGDKSALAVKIMQSRTFLSDFVRRHDIVPEVMAAEEWNPITRKLTYDEDDYNAETDTWVRDFEPPQQQEPSDWEIVEEFRLMLEISTDDLTSFTTISIEHPSPVLAKRWVEWLVEDINNEIRARDRAEAERSLEYLQTELRNITLTNMQQIFYQMVEQQTHTIMMTKVRPEYVFQMVDPPVVAEEESWPPRAALCIGITLFGGLLAAVGLLIANMFRRGESVVD